MEIAKVLPTQPGETPLDTGAVPEAGGGLKRDPETAGGAPRYCPKCLSYGDLTAVDYRLPEGTLCEFHAAEESRRKATVPEFQGADAPNDCNCHHCLKRRADAARLPPECECCHSGRPCECCELHWTPEARAADALMRVVLARMVAP